MKPKINVIPRGDRCTVLIDVDAPQIPMSERYYARVFVKAETVLHEAMRKLDKNIAAREDDNYTNLITEE